jgi:hypothetical protein
MVKRYSLNVAGEGWDFGDAYPVAEEDPTGDYVYASDYDALAAERDALRSRLANLEAAAATNDRGVMALRAVSAEARLAEAERDNKRLDWLVANGERVFGSLWRDAGTKDIDAFLTPADQPTVRVE